MNAETAQTKPARRRARGAAIAFLLVGALLALFPGFTADYAHALTAPDGIYVPNPRHEFAAAQSGTLTHTFRIYNLRPRRLTVQAEPDCGCTGTSWESATLAPFSWKDLTATLQAKPQANAHAKPASASRSVGIALRTDSAAQPFVFVFLVA